MTQFEMMMLSDKEKQDFVNNVSKDISFEQEDFENEYSHDHDEQEEEGLI